MTEQSREQQLAYEWAKSQHFTSVAASHARTLAYAVSELLDELQTLQTALNDLSGLYQRTEGHLSAERKTTALLQAERDKLIDGLHLWIRKTADEETYRYLTSLLEGVGVTV